MDNLAFSLRTLCQHNADGSHMTRAQRSRGLDMIARDLRSLGFRLPDAGSLKPKHVQRLILYWERQGISNATMKNRLGWIRWWAMKTNKPGLLPRDNSELGIGERSSFKGQRAAITPADRREQLPERMQLAIRLQMAFGLRLEESLKFRVEAADKGTILVMQPSWTKGGRARTIPIVHQRQRDLLDQVRDLTRDGSLIPEGMNYIRFRKQFERQALQAGISNMHKHRHWYACWRYRTLAGVDAPCQGGPLHDQLDDAERERLDAVRLQISQELGHGRIHVTNTYLGHRWPGKRTA